MKHNVLIDISGRLEKANSENVALAFSNDIEAAIFVPGKVKLEANETLRRAGVPRKRRGVRILVAGLFLLLEDFLPQFDHITIDDELPGWGGEIKQQLLDQIKRNIPDFRSSKLNIDNIGEGTRADKLAWMVRKKQAKPYKKLGFQDLLSIVSKDK